MSTWLTGDAVAFDIETTGVDVHNDRIVTACAVRVGKDGAKFLGRWLLDPGVPIPESATAIHGITTEKARTDGMAAFGGIITMAGVLLRAWNEGLPVVVMNAQFDLTLLQAELARHGQEPLSIGPVLDPLVIDRGLEPYRKGKRTLAALAERYKVKQDGAHSSDGDALTAARIVWAQAREHWPIEKYTLAEMQAWQAECHRKWAANLEIHRRSLGKPEVIDGDWPVRNAA